MFPIPVNPAVEVYSFDLYVLSFMFPSQVHQYEVQVSEIHRLVFPQLLF